MYANLFSKTQTFPLGLSNKQSSLKADEISQQFLKVYCLQDHSQVYGAENRYMEGISKHMKKEKVVANNYTR